MHMLWHTSQPVPSLDFSSTCVECYAGRAGTWWGILRTLHGRTALSCADVICSLLADKTWLRLPACQYDLVIASA